MRRRPCQQHRHPAFFFLSSILVFFLLNAALCAAGERGDDLRAAFARAANGAPLRAVAIGGSITQAGQGWAGAWLKEMFPKSTVTMANAGMSATGSGLGVFRIARDVIALQPDLVFIEYAVNDGGLSDEEAIRYTESIVVRLKKLPNPPAVVFLEVAAKTGSNRARHQKIAAHYGLVDIDLQVKLDAYLKSSGTPWGKVMGDDVHPNAEGHKLYAQWIGEDLKAYLPASGAAASYPPTPLPAQLSAKPLLLDGRLVNLAQLCDEPDWSRENSLPFWWNMFFNGVLSSKTDHALLTLSARGTHIGLFYALDKSYGDYRTTVDGMAIGDADCHHRGGYAYSIIAKDLEPKLHRIQIAVQSPAARPVKLGYLMIAGDTNASEELATQGPVSVEILRDLKFRPIAAAEWKWCGPYGGKTAVWPSADLQTVFAPEAALTGQSSTEEILWKDAPTTEGPTVDFAKATGVTDRGVCYARTTLQSSKGGQVLLGFALDYFGKLWVNGKLVRTIDSGHGGASSPVRFFANLQPGANEIVVKIHAGSKGHNFALYLEDTFAPNLPTEIRFQ